MQKEKVIPKHLDFFCLVCDKKIQLCQMSKKTLSCPPDDAVAFYAHGNWGSRVFDPMDGSLVYAVVCDKCFITKSHNMIYDNHANGRIEQMSTDFRRWFKRITKDNLKEYFTEFFKKKR